MFSFLPGDYIALITLILSFVIFYAGTARHRQAKIDALREGLTTHIETRVGDVSKNLTESMEKIAAQVQNMASTYAQKEDLRLHMQYQTELLQEVRKEQGRIQSRLDDVMKLALQQKNGEG